MKKYWLTSSFFLLFLLCGGIIFLSKNSHQVIKNRDYIIVSVQGEAHYNRPLTFPKGQLIWQILIPFHLTIQANLKSIYQKVKTQWVKIDYRTKIYNDTVLKITN